MLRITAPSLEFQINLKIKVTGADRIYTYGILMVECAKKRHNVLSRAEKYGFSVTTKNERNKSMEALTNTDH
ncbi:MAG: hypothetical protein FWF87_08885 [Synergistaceae bacterium]|nr:hypothetical protein [Synergistaceae bacterium]